MSVKNLGCMFMKAVERGDLGAARELCAAVQGVRDLADKVHTAIFLLIDNKRVLPAAKVDVISMLDEAFPEISRQSSEQETIERFVAQVEGTDSTREVGRAVQKFFRLAGAPGLEEDDEKEQEVSGNYHKMSNLDLGNALKYAAIKGDIEAIQAIRKCPYFSNLVDRKLDDSLVLDGEEFPSAQDVGIALLSLLRTSSLPEDGKVGVIEALKTFPERYLIERVVREAIQEELNKLEGETGEKLRSAMVNFYKVNSADINAKVEALLWGSVKE